MERKPNLLSDSYKEIFYKVWVEKELVRDLETERWSVSYSSDSPHSIHMDTDLGVTLWNIRDVSILGDKFQIVRVDETR